MSSVLTVSTKRSAKQFARRQRGGIFTTSIPAPARAVSKAVVNWPARSRTRNRKLDIERGWESPEGSLRYLEEVVQLEGPHTIAAILVEPVTGTNGVLVPPDGYLQGIRALCDRHGILLIADEVMTGFGRTGTWFAVEHWNVVPDLITMAKGLTSAYVQLGAVGMRQKIADTFQDRPFPGGLTYGSHPVACAAALATIAVYEEDGLIDRARRLGVVMAERLADLAARHPSVGAVRSLGLFGVVEIDQESQNTRALGPLRGDVTGNGGARCIL